MHFRLCSQDDEWTSGLVDSGRRRSDTNSELRLFP